MRDVKRSPLRLRGGADRLNRPRGGPHPLYTAFIGMPRGIVVDQQGPHCLCGDPHPCAKSPLVKDPQPQPEYRALRPGNSRLSFGVCEGTFAALTAPTVAACGVFALACGSGGLAACPLAFAACGYEAAGAYACYSQAHGGSVPTFPEPPPGERMEPGGFGLE